jgi:hypothetical protein
MLDTGYPEALPEFINFDPYKRQLEIRTDDTSDDGTYTI